MHRGIWEYRPQCAALLRGRTGEISAVEVTGLSPRPGLATDSGRFYAVLKAALAENRQRVEAHRVPDLMPGVEGFRLLHKIGEGGMASVYLATPAAGGPQCVIKPISALPNI